MAQSIADPRTDVHAFSHVPASSSTCDHRTRTIGNILISFPDQGHLFVAVNCAKFRGTATSQKREFRGHFAAKIDNFAAISRPKFWISRSFRGKI